MTAPERPKRVVVTEAEMVELIMRSGHNHRVQMTFGPGWAALDPEGPSYRWALEQLAELRGVTPDN